MEVVEQIIELLEKDKDKGLFELKVLGKKLDLVLDSLKQLEKRKLEDYSNTKEITDYASSLAYRTSKEQLEYVIKGEIK